MDNQDRADPEQPCLSVVVPSVNGWGDLEPCLAALCAQATDDPIEILVPDRVGESVRGPLRRRFPNVRILPAAAEVTIPGLRAQAFKAARGEFVAVIEDHVIVPPDWAKNLLAAHRDDAMVVGGAVDNAARNGVVDWAAFLCEYSQCLAPQAGPVEWLAGNNVSYRRSLLDTFRNVIDEGRWEDHLHARMRNAGITLLSRPDIVVAHNKHYRVGDYLAQRFFYARAYAGMRVERFGPLGKWAYGLAAFGLFPILLFRVSKSVFEARRYRLQFLRSFPLLLLFLASWAVGETVGAWIGPGDALSRVC